MPLEDAQKFMAMAAADAALRAQVGALKGSGVLTQMAGLAATMGLHFTADEYRQAVVAASEGELEEEALGQVLDELGLERKSPSQQ